MRIDFVEIENFRRLDAIRIEFSESTTLFVGANNSGKTSAITALRYFLIEPKTQRPFSVYDIPLAHWTRINELGDAFGDAQNEEPPYKWKDLLPSLDIWLKVTEGEIHRVIHLISKLEWSSDHGIGVRLQLEPKDPEELLEEYLKAKNAASNTLKAQRTPVRSTASRRETGGGASGKAGPRRRFALWPENLMDFLKKRMARLTVNAYLLDPFKKQAPEEGVARPQKLPDDVEPLDDSPFKGLIEIDEVPAHRGLSDYSGTRGDDDESGQDEKGRKQLLTAQLRSYYGKHLDPEKAPNPSDIQALQAIHDAQIVFDERLKECFETSLAELQQLGYPGVANPRLTISTSLKPVEALKHQSAVQYDVAPTDGKGGTSYRLPEQYNGLGYQNLISMVFRLISFRDDWLKVGKAAQTDEGTATSLTSPPPLHLVLLEEPEAHLHVQVQQVFIRKAYDVLRNHPDLQGESPLSTQLVVSTHSSHIAHEVDFARMRYFRRHPARNPGETPTSRIVNLSEVFGTPDDTARFVSRYLLATHADLLFADGAILVEGAAERMLVPHFIRQHYETLHSCYITLLEVGGSHAHRLASLIEYLGLNTLIITDIDAVRNAPNRPKTRPQKGVGLLTASNVLKRWHPQKEPLDDLLDLAEEVKVRNYGDLFSVRVAYQTKLEVRLNDKEKPSIVYPRTFEDALALENVDFFRNAKGPGFAKTIRDAIGDNTSVRELHEVILDRLEKTSKAEFALDLLYYEDPAAIRVPEYIRNGLEWLQEQLLLRQQEVLVARNEGAQTCEARLQ